MNIIKTISHSETMMDGDLNRYLTVGESALEAIQRAIGKKLPLATLDLPCGHGRVARFMRASYPETKLYVSDLDEPGMNFCAETFDAIPLQSTPRFEDIEFNKQFDLIWVGSLVTHLSADRTKAFFGFLRRHLTPNGSAIVTTHGAFVAGRLFCRNTTIYGIDPVTERSILEDYMSDGYGYQDYPNQSGYGISLMSKEWVAREANDAGLRVVRHEDWSAPRKLIQVL
jgi:hypothetical protein